MIAITADRIRRILAAERDLNGAARALTAHRIKYQRAAGGLTVKTRTGTARIFPTCGRGRPVMVRIDGGNNIPLISDFVMFGGF